jgi:glycosyltransferase involved in cell wall biosynthesis
MQKRLLSINNYHYRRGGADMVFLEHDAMFRSIGWETAVFAMQHPQNIPSPWEHYFAEELELGGDYGLLRKLAMASKVIYSREARKKLEGLLGEFRPDVAHAHNIYHHLSPSILSLLHERGIPTVMTAHDLKLACPAYKMLNREGICERCKHGNLLHLIKHRCIHNSLPLSGLIAIESSAHRILGLYRKNLDKIITPSQFFRNKLMEWGWAPEKLVYIPNYVRASDYTTQFQPGRHFLYFGRLAPEKGVDTLIRACGRLNTKLCIAGSGPYEATLREIAEPFSATIEFLGYRTGEELKSLLGSARAVVLPSQWYENAPMSILEAYASGKIVVAANIGGIPEMVVAGETGFLFESGNVEELAGCLTKVSSLPDETIAQMGVRARDYVSQTFPIDRYLEEMLNLYQSLGVGDLKAEFSTER